MSELSIISEKLRHETARLKVRRLKLPLPGALVRTRSSILLFDAYDSNKRFVPSKTQCIVLGILTFPDDVCYNSSLVDPVILYLLKSSDAKMYSTGKISGREFVTFYEVIA